VPNGIDRCIRNRIDITFKGIGTPVTVSALK